MTLATELKALGEDIVMSTQQRQVRALEIMLVAAKGGALEGLCIASSHLPEDGHCGASLIISDPRHLAHLARHVNDAMHGCMSLMLPQILKQIDEEEGVFSDLKGSTH